MVGGDVEQTGVWGMLTAEDYRQSIRDGRASYLEGRRIDDPARHPLLRVSVDWVASTYERTGSAAAGGRNPIFDQPTTTAELDEQMNFLIEADPTAASTAGCMALVNVAPLLAEAKPEYRERLERFLRRCREGDLRVAAAVEDGGSLRVVRRTKDGVVLQGAKRSVLGAAVVHELCVVPAGAVSQENADRAIACAVAVDTPGLKIISITTAPRAEDPRHFPISREKSITDCTVLFDEVFVPWDRVFLDGEVAYSGALADALGTWERARAAANLADEAELIFGLAQTITEMNGVPDATHIMDKLSKMAVWASMCRAGWTAALVHAATTAAGMVVPADNHVYATMAYGRSLFNEMVSYLHDVSGALLLTCPTVADYENPDTHDYMEKYLRTMDGVTGEDRMKIFHVIRDLTADHYGGWAKVTNQMVGGGLQAQRMATLRTFPSEAAKARARRVARIPEQ
jgi:4-hydroxybutyryl-CoA dehydratase/vinylacetyl-CoA-Delta-isomerase